MEHASVGVSLLNFRLFGMYYKARSNLRCVFIIIFVYLAFNRAKRIHHSPYYIVTGENIDALLKVKLNTVNIHKVLLIWNCDIRFIGTRSWVSRSKRELLKFPTWKKKKAIQNFHLVRTGCSNHSNLEMEAECLTKTLSCLNLNISRTKNCRNKL